MKIINLISNLPKKDFYLFNVIIPLFFLIFALIFMPVDQVFYFDTDEGIELTKAGLFSQNLLFNQDFWDPQPLLFNILLGKYLDIFGVSIINARIFILFFATILIWCFTQILRLCVGNTSTVITVFLLIISSNFLRLSVSVMQGIPCLTLALISIYFFLLYNKNFKLFWLILSGITLGISLQFKMITIFLIPVILLYLFITIPQWKQKIFLFFSFLISLSLSFVIIGLLTSSLDLQKIFLFHISADLKKDYQNHKSLRDVILIYLQNFDLLLLTIVGLNIKSIKTIIKNKENNFYLLPLFWLITITLLLINHKPVWYHYIVLITIPLIWLGSYGIENILISSSLNNQSNQNKKFIYFPNFNIFKNKFTIFTIIFTLLVIPIKIGVIHWQNNLFIEESKARFANLERILIYKNQTNWLFTDLAMYGFYSKINLPPEIAVLPGKRLVSGNLNQQELLTILEKYQPEQILITRFPIILTEINPYVESNYHKIYEDEKTTHYILKSLT
jgi:4-amino-4-deoxy-L-arabinose transferase-like glycosyltransferase